MLEYNIRNLILHKTMWSQSLGNAGFIKFKQVSCSRPSESLSDTNGHWVLHHVVHAACLESPFVFKAHLTAYFRNLGSNSSSLIFLILICEPSAHTIIKQIFLSVDSVAVFPCLLLYSGFQSLVTLNLKLSPNT